MSKWTIYTDGSYNKENPTEVHGSVIVQKDNDLPLIAHVISNDKSLCSGWNVGGELLAAFTALEIVGKASNNEPCDVDYIFDYEGIGAWGQNYMGFYDGVGWKIKKGAKASAQWYFQALNFLQTHYSNLHIHWIWVKGHATTPGNLLADKYASWDMLAVKKDKIKTIIRNQFEF